MNEPINPAEHCPQKVLRELLALESLTEEEENLKKALLEMKAGYDEHDRRCQEIHDKYRLKGQRKKESQYYDYKGNPISMWEWSELNTYHKKIALTFTNGYRISTVYLGIDHGWPSMVKEGEIYFPVIFETMIFAETKKLKGSEIDDYQERYSFEEQAFMGHIRAVQMVMNHV